MSPNAKTLLGIITFLPLFFGLWWLVDYIMLFISFMRLAVENPDSQTIWREYYAHFFSGSFLSVMLLCILSHFAVMIYYIIHAAKNKLKSEGERAMWILLFIFIGSIAFIIYFFMRVVPRQQPEQAQVY